MEDQQQTLLAPYTLTVVKEDYPRPHLFMKVLQIPIVGV